MSSFTNHFLKITQSSDDCVFFLDDDFRLVFCNEAFAQHLKGAAESGYEQWYGTDFENLDLADNLKSCLQTAHQGLSTDCSEIENTIPMESEDLATSVKAYCAQVISDAGANDGYVCRFSIICQTNDAAFGRTMLNNLMDNCEAMIYFKDLNSRFTRVSQSMVKRLGAKDKQSLLGKSDFDFWEEDCARSFFDDEQNIISTRQAVIGKAEKEQRNDGRTTWVLTSKMPLIDEQGNVVGTYGISKDITYQKECELNLERTHRELVDASRQAGMAEVATNVIHNVGNVLNSINVSVSQADDVTRSLKTSQLGMVAQLLNDNSATPDFLANDDKGKRIPNYLTMLAAELEQDATLIRDELGATQRHLQHVKTIVSMQQEYATSTCVAEIVELAEVVEDAIRMSSGSMKRHGIELVRDFQRQGTASISKHRVLQILVNLIRNAKHAVQDRDQEYKCVTVSVEDSDPGFISISVTDNGIGVAKENLIKLFNHGFSTKKNGHGFGLHSGANAAKEMGGALTVESEGIGKGAKFILKLPIAEVDTQPEKIAPIFHSPLGADEIGISLTTTSQ